MSNPQTSVAHRLAASLARAAARAWPEESRHWGIALEAELIDIEGPSASLRWAIGGVMLLTRAWWTHILRSWNRPAGVPEGGPLEALAKNASRVPRTPRFVTAILLLASITLLMIPDVQQGITASFDAWTRQQDILNGNSSPATLTRLRDAAERNHDPQAMALIAMVSRDRAERVKMADEAVRLDSSLTWIYSTVRTTDDWHAAFGNPTPSEWLVKLQKWDPDNAVPRMLVAEQSLIQFDEIFAKGSYWGNYSSQAKQYLEKDPKWLAAMEFEIQAPMYDDYSSRRFDLYRMVALRYSIRDSQILQATVNPVPVWMSNAWAVRNLQAYDLILFERGEAAERAGNYEAAKDLYSKPGIFSKRMADQSHTEIQRRAWGQIQSDSLNKLQPLLLKMGRSDEAAQVGHTLTALQTERFPSGPVRPWSWNENGWEGFMIRSFTAAIFLLGVLSLGSLGVLFLRRHVAAESRGFGMALASLAVDFCPLLLLLACAGLFVAYRPVALMYDQYMTWSLPIYDFSALTHALNTPYETPDGISGIVVDIFNPVHYWMAAIAGLCMIPLYIVFRRVMRSRAVVSL